MDDLLVPLAWSHNEILALLNSQDGLNLHYNYQCHHSNSKYEKNDISKERYERWKLYLLSL